MNLFNNLIAEKIRYLLVFSVSYMLLNPVAFAEQSNKYNKTPASGISKIQNPHTSSDGAKAETIDKVEQRQPSTLQHWDRAVSNEHNKKLGGQPPGATISSQSSSPINSTQKQNSKTIRKQPEQSNSNYNSLTNEVQTFTTKDMPQWSDYRSHDPGKTILNPQISNKQFDNSIKVNHPSLNRPVSLKPDSKDYRLSPEPGDIQFGDGRSGRITPATKNTGAPSYRTGNGSSIIDTRHGFNSDMDSVPANNNAGMTKTHQNDSKNNYLQNSKTTGKKTYTGFKRKPVNEDPSEEKGSK